MKLGAAHQGERERSPTAGGPEGVPGYRLLQRLDGRGDVWSAEGPGGFKAMLRFLRLAPGSDPEELQGAALLRTARHPNVQAAFGSWRVGTNLAVATELPDRSLLDRYLEAVAAGEPGIPRDELIDHMAEAARGIDYLNGNGKAPGEPDGRGVTHGAISPRTILFVGGGVKVTDIDPTRWGATPGVPGSALPDPSRHPEYAAPERLAGRTSPHSDQYSLAVTYCRLRTGGLPGSGRNGRTVDLASLPEDERPAVARALARDPDRRWPSCRAFVEAIRADLQAAERGRLAPAPESPAPEPEAVVPAVLPRPRPALGRATALTLAAASSAATIAGALWINVAATPRVSADRRVVNRGIAPPARFRDQDPGDAAPPAPAVDGPDPALTPRPAPEPNRASSPPLRVRAPGPLVADRPSQPPAPVRVPADAVASAPGPKPAAAAPPASKPPAAVAEAPAPAPRRPSPAASTAVLVTERRPKVLRMAGGGPPAVEGAIPAVEPPEVTGPAPDALAAVRAGAAALAPVGPEDAGPAPTPAPAPPPARTTAPAPPRREVAAAAPGSIRVEAPRELSVAAGKSASLPVSVVSVGVKAPVKVWLERLPRGVTASDRDATPAAPQAGPGHALEVRADAEAQGEALALLVAEAGPTRAEETVRLTVVPPPHLVARRRGDALLRREDYAGATAAYNEAVRLEPSDYLALHGRGLAAFNHGDYEQAMADLDASLRIKPDVPTALNNRGLARLALGDTAAAIADFDAAARLDPHYAVVRYNRGRAHAQAGAADLAIADYEEALRIDPKFAKAYKARADILAKRGEPDRDLALADYATALRLDPDDATALNNRGLLLFAKGEFHRSIADFDEAIRVKPKYAVARYNRGRVYAYLGDAVEAVASFDQALKIDPKLVRASQAREEILSGRKNPTRTKSGLGAVTRLEPGPSASGPAPK